MNFEFYLVSRYIVYKSGSAPARAPKNSRTDRPLSLSESRASFMWHIYFEGRGRVVHCRVAAWLFRWVGVGEGGGVAGGEGRNNNRAQRSGGARGGVG